MNLQFVRVVKREEKRAPVSDQRRRLNVVLAEYQGEDGYEYRKSFESYGEPVVPQSGTSAELSAAKRQWA